MEPNLHAIRKDGKELGVMIARVWHGYTTRENAKRYEQLLQTKVLPKIEREHGRGVQLIVRELPGQNEIEFITVCYFEDIDQIKQFAGEDYERCVVPEAARILLKRFDERSQHYELKRQGP